MDTFTMIPSQLLNQFSSTPSTAKQKSPNYNDSDTIDYLNDEENYDVNEVVKELKVIGNGHSTRKNRYSKSLSFNGYVEQCDNDLIDQNDQNSGNNHDNEELISGLVWNHNESVKLKIPVNKLIKLIQSVTLVNENLWHIPQLLISQYASRVRRLDLSFNCLQTLNGIEYFNCLEELVLDNNLLNDTIRFFYNPFMRILSINKNRLNDLEKFLNEVTFKFPGLIYLSLLGNPACPDQLSSSEHDEKDYTRYRSYVVHRLPQLKFLDSTLVKKTERIEAKQRGHYYRLIRLNSDSAVETNRKKKNSEEITLTTEMSTTLSDKKKISPLPHQNDSTPKGAFGKLRHRYTGKHSEGNRFIRNHEL